MLIFGFKYTMRLMINTFAYINRNARERYEVYSQKDCKYP